MADATHDLVVKTIAATRFPFPDQTTWPAGYVTNVNAGNPQIAIDTPAGKHYPDIVITDATGRIREMGEVEMAISEAALPYMTAGSALTDNDTPTKVKHFFVYVPAGQEEKAKTLLEGANISYAGVRGFTVEDGKVGIVPFATAGDSYDHQVTAPIAV